jgi:hypothetical protein
MTHESGNSCCATRRALLQAAVGGAGALTLLGLGVRNAHAGKIPQAAVAYSTEPNGTQICKNCTFFVAPNACKPVDGEISPDGHCKIGSYKAV